MKLIFAGTPEFAACALRSLLDAGHEIALVLTQPDRPSGRGMKTRAAPVKQVAEAARLNVLQPATLKDVQIQQTLREVKAEVMVVAAYGLILPPAVLDVCHHGAINIHASLLPRWRGAAPIQRALLAGDRRTGISIMQMDAGLDTGPVLLQEALDIGPDETAQSLHDRLAQLGARLIVKALQDVQQGKLSARPQPEQGATYAQKLNKAESKVDWSAPAQAIDLSIRAYSPFPGATARMGDTELKLWRAAAIAADQPAAAPGEVLRADDQGIVVACGAGQLALLELQRPGGRRMPAGEFLRGFPVSPGDRFEPV